MKNISITGKFLALLASFGLFALAMAFYAGSQIVNVADGYSGLLTAEGDASTSLSRANQAFQNIRGSISDIILTNNKEQEKKATDDIAASRQQFSTYIDKAIADLPADASIADLKVRAAAVLDQSCANSLNLGLKALTYIDLKSATEVFFTDCQPQFRTMGKALSDKVTELADSTGASSQTLSGASRSIYWTTIGGVLVGLLVILAVSFVAIKTWLVRPVNALGAAMTRLAGGDLTTDVDGTERRDEIGGMARAVAVFKQNGLKAVDLEQAAAAERNEAESERRRVADQDRSRAAAMADATNGLAEGLSHLSSGDLTFQLTKPFAAEFEGLRADFNRAVTQLSATLSSVAQATSSIDSGSREVSRSADDLSRRTEQQAASLEETAAALDEITVNVTNSSRRAEEARNVAIQANENARQSGVVVADAMGAMGKIEQSSSQISSIIGVIDDIAFQTNLLALNAGVEAARAGEAGKGFAVVAQEVRELAQRSAKAAREIKDLIRNSTAEVEHGVDLVGKAGEALKTIETYIVTINQHMDAIATSAREQSTGLAEVNSAVNQMDQVTQQNAAMVEEANAAGATLAGDAGRLRDLIGQFRLGAGEIYAPTSQLRSRPIVGGASRSPSSLAASPASSVHAPAASPARGMMGKLAQAFGGRSFSAAAAGPAASADNWEEF